MHAAMGRRTGFGLWDMLPTSSLRLSAFSFILALMAAISSLALSCLVSVLAVAGEALDLEKSPIVPILAHGIPRLTPRRQASAQNLRFAICK